MSGVASSAPSVHPTAVVSAHAQLGEGVIVGPLCVIGDDVTIGAGTRLVASCIIVGSTHLGERNTVHPFAVLGGEPQDKSYAGEPTRLEVGSGNVFHEHVTVHRGTSKARGVTHVGSHGFYMAGVHIGHDAIVGDHVTLANDTLVAGLVEIGHHVTCGGGAALAPFVRIGEGAFVAGGAMVGRDVPPWTIAAGDRARVRALNKVALERCAVPMPSRQALERAFRLLYRHAMPRSKALECVKAELGEDPYVTTLVAFLESCRDPSERRGKNVLSQ